VAKLGPHPGTLVSIVVVTITMTSVFLVPLPLVSINSPEGPLGSSLPPRASGGEGGGDGK